MTLLEILILLVIAGLCGAVGQAIAGGSRGGCLVAIVLGFVGAAVGVWIARAIELPAIFTIRVGDVDFPIVWAVIGAALFVAIIRLVAGGRRVD
jgi:uncharacterized membrane protein YeaQ/YmgE (transglycosylase-associated protein family)